MPLARRFLVGDPALQRIDALAGATLERMDAAKERTGRGEIVVSQEVAEGLGDGLAVAGWRKDARTGSRFAVVDGLARKVTPMPWPGLPEGALTEEQVRQWVLPAVYDQLRSGAEVLGDPRPVTPLLLKFGGLDFDGDDDAGEKLDAFVSWVQRVVHRHGGTLVQLTVGNKGTFMYAAFGAPVAHEDDPARAMRAALTLRDRFYGSASLDPSTPPELDYIEAVQIGLTRGEMWTGACGAAARHTYGVIGSEVNLSARLMAKAQPGQILVSGWMRGQPGLASVFDLEHVGDLLYKGFADPIPTYELRGERLTGERFFPDVMVGRDAELQQLLDFAQPLFAGKLAGVALCWLSTACCHRVR